MIDPNRGEEDPTLVMRLYDGSVVPENRRIGAAGIEERLERLYRPYHAAYADLAANGPQGARVIVASVSEGDPFIVANSQRLKSIGWLMVAGQIAAMVLGLMLERVASLTGTHSGGSDLSLNGLLAILLVFVLAGVFERGAQMREELEGTI